MHFIRLFLSVIILFLSASLCSQTDLFPINVDGKYGYINSKSETVIVPKYFYAGRFVDGLAEVREDGLYGYIDSTGEYVIPPAFDYAYPFLDGMANIHYKGKSGFVDRNGKKLFLDVDGYVSRSGVKDLFFYHKYPEDNISSVKNKYALIDKEGNWITDTVFTKMERFYEDVLVVGGKYGNYHVLVDGLEGKENGVIDKSGKFTISYGKFSNIDRFINGVAWAHIESDKGGKKSVRSVLIDTKGKIIFDAEEKNWGTNYTCRGFRDGLMVIEISKNIDGLRESYSGAINRKGKLVMSNEKWTNMVSFKEGRAFVQEDSYQWKMIDKEGNVLHNFAITDIILPTIFWRYDEYFNDGIAAVQVEGKWTTIDREGKLGIPSGLEGISGKVLKRRGNLVFFSKNADDSENKYRDLHGIWDLKTGRVLEAKYDFIEIKDPKEGLLAARKGDTRYYLNRKFDVIWSSNQKEVKTKFNIDHMNRGYFHASSPKMDKYRGYGGWGGSSNLYSIMDSSMKAKGGLEIKISDMAEVVFWEKYLGQKMVILNDSKDTMFFSAQDSRLYLVVQAQNEEGVWKDIEYLPSSWCGNSYHTLYLPPEHYWDFVFPKYHGSIQTKIRAKLIYKTVFNSDEDMILYSNEIEGSVNPGQFYVKLKYKNHGLMDPYDD